uniref:SecY-independent transporter protein n=1 Tax=Pyropia fucicola TaxID=144551 RepID=A0A060DDB1_9RHOD|nr:SecY-independent transporter protein [Neopyropia fucicola]AIB08127.1 SecY-independent transporter protein [Neopyropia fucicola]
MQIPLRCYLTEFKFRLVYFLLSFSFSLLIIINHHEAVIFFETYTFLFINDGRFIATHIAELFATSIYISFNLVLFINYPFLYYHCSRFLNSSWYKSQVWFFKNMQSLTFVTFSVTLLLCYFLIFPYTFAFLDTWTITTVYAFKVQLEARIETYVCWTLQTVCLLSNIVYLFFTRITYFYLVDNMINLHLFFRENKKYTLFFICLSASVCLPQESFIQITFLICIIILLELFFLVTCLFFAKNNV